MNQAETFRLSRVQGAKPNLEVSCDGGVITGLEIFPDSQLLTYGEVISLLSQVGIQLDSIRGKMDNNVPLEEHQLHPGKRSLQDGTLRHVAQRVNGNLQNILYFDAQLS
jgi:hypothetical protein